MVKALKLEPQQIGQHFRINLGMWAYCHYLLVMKNVIFIWYEGFHLFLYSRQLVGRCAVKIAIYSFDLE